MAEKMLSEKLGEVEYDGLINYRGKAYQLNNKEV